MVRPNLQRGGGACLCTADISLGCTNTKGAFHLSELTDRPDQSRRNENFTFNQNYPARSIKS